MLFRRLRCSALTAIDSSSTVSVCRRPQKIAREINRKVHKTQNKKTLLHPVKRSQRIERKLDTLNWKKRGVLCVCRLFFAFFLRVPVHWGPPPSADQVAERGSVNPKRAKRFLQILMPASKMNLQNTIRSSTSSSSSISRAVGLIATLLTLSVALQFPFVDGYRMQRTRKWCFWCCGYFNLMESSAFTVLWGR